MNTKTLFLPYGISTSLRVRDLIVSNQRFIVFSEGNSCDPHARILQGVARSKKTTVRCHKNNRMNSIALRRSL